MNSSLLADFFNSFAICSADILDTEVVPTFVASILIEPVGNAILATLIVEAFIFIFSLYTLTGMVGWSIIQIMKLSRNQVQHVAKELVESADFYLDLRKIRSKIQRNERKA